MIGQHTDETKQRIRAEAAKRIPFIRTDEYRLKMSDSLKRRHALTPNFNKASGASRPRSQEQRDNAAAAQRGRVRSEKTKQKLRAAWVRRKLAGKVFMDTHEASTLE